MAKTKKAREYRAVRKIRIIIYYGDFITVRLLHVHVCKVIVNNKPPSNFAQRPRRNQRMYGIRWYRIRGVARTHSGFFILEGFFFDFWRIFMHFETSTTLTDSLWGGFSQEPYPKYTHVQDSSLGKDAFGLLVMSW